MGRGDRIGGDVVMRGPDAARGEQQIVGAAQGPVQRADRIHDAVGVVGDDADLLEVDAGGGQHLGQVVGVPLARATRQDLVTDDQDGGCGVVGLHGALPWVWRLIYACGRGWNKWARVSI